MSLIKHLLSYMSIHKIPSVAGIFVQQMQCAFVIINMLSYSIFLQFNHFKSTVPECMIRLCFNWETHPTD